MRWRRTCTAILDSSSPRSCRQDGSDGHHSKAAYDFYRIRLARRIWAIKGRGGPGIPVWPRRPTRTNKGKIPLFIIGVDAVKDAV